MEDNNTEEKKEKDEARIFVILGMRRSGTSIMRKIIAASPDVDTMLFEPHPLWHSVMMKHFKRFRGPEHHKRVEAFRNSGRGGKVAGVKWALNPGIDALDFIWLERVFPEAKFVIVFRDEDDTYQSYVNLDKNARRGAVPKHIYMPMFKWLEGCLWYFVDSHKDKAIAVNYERVVEDPEKEMAKVWKLLGIRAPKDLGSMIHKPENRKAEEKKSVAKEIAKEKKTPEPAVIKPETRPKIINKSTETMQSGIPKISGVKPGRPIKIKKPVAKKAKK